MLRSGKPAEFVVATLRKFPSLEPTKIQPVSAKVLGLTPRRDILWQAVTFERDAERAGSKTIIGRSDLDYSRKKLRPQKGSGRARMGDRANPIRHDGAFAHNKHAPINHKTALNHQVYSLAVRHALSLLYKEGNLFIVDGDIEFSKSNPLIGQHFINQHNASGLQVTFVTSEVRPNLFDSTTDCKRVDVVPVEMLNVQDLLKAKRLLIEKRAFEWLVGEYSPKKTLEVIQPQPVGESATESASESVS